jgi:hypothetical protein
MSTAHDRRDPADRGAGVAGLIAAVALCVFGAAARAAEDARPAAPDPAATRVLVAGPEYEVSGLHRVLLGHGYRRLWTTPIEVDVLDLGTFSGGLVPRERTRGKETIGLKLEGRDGRKWRFRSVDKDTTPVLPEGLRTSWVRKIVQDQISAAVPAGCLVVDVLGEAAGILGAKCRLVVLPDAPELGEFRKEFAGMLGTLEEQVQVVPPVTPGFAGSSRIVETDELEGLLDSGPAERLDSRAFLRARLFDVLIGDDDRHRFQWLWARSRDTGRWEPVPMDRDHAFVKYEGALMDAGRLGVQGLVNFGEKYPAPLAITWLARTLDRRHLSDLEWTAWEEVVRDMQARLTDAVVKAAVQAMPAPYYRECGATLAARLEARRDRLPAFARRFYEMLAQQVEVHGTDAPDTARILRGADGSVEIALSGPGGPYFQRTFLPRETREVRVFLKGGDDRAVSEGSGRTDITVRVIGGDGDDVLDDSAAGHMLFYDSSSENRVVEGLGTRTDDRPYPPPPLDSYGNPPRDWGAEFGARPGLVGGGDYGLGLSVSLQRTVYGFRKQPYDHRHSLGFAYSTSVGRGAIEYAYDSLRTDGRGRFDVVARASAIDLIHYHGLGNETSERGPEALYDVRQTRYLLAPSFRFDTPVDLWFGPVVAYARTDLPAASLVGAQRPYGVPGFGQVGARVRASLERRYHDPKSTRGVRAAFDGAFYPAMWDVAEPFGEVHGEAAGFLTAPLPLEPSLAVRVGGRRVWGRYPLHEAAFLGGDQVRGLAPQRYAGDAAAYANSELRLLLRHRDGTILARLGVFGLVDAGRVFLKGESSDRWHAGFGGGFWLSIFDPAYTASMAVAQSEGHVRVYFQGGLMF